jgi:hypothetical protein
MAVRNFSWARIDWALAVTDPYPDSQAPPSLPRLYVKARTPLGLVPCMLQAAPCRAAACSSCQTHIHPSSPLIEHTPTLVDHAYGV